MINFRALSWFLFGVTLALMAGLASASGWSYGSECHASKVEAMRAALRDYPRLTIASPYLNQPDPCADDLGVTVCVFLDPLGHPLGSYRLFPCDGGLDV